MTADHDDLVLEPGVGSGNLGDGVEAVFVVPGEPGVDVHFHGDGDVRGDHAGEPVVVLDHHDRVGEVDRVFALLRGLGEVGAIVVKDDAGTAAVFAVAAGRDNGKRALVGHHF